MEKEKDKLFAHRKNALEYKKDLLLLKCTFSQG